jgi:DnaJ-like protein
MEDPYAVLGLAPGASEREVAAAYRHLAKQMHPDLSGDGPTATARMAALNAAHDALRDGAGAAPSGASGHWTGGRSAGRPADPLRRTLGHELLRVLDPDEPLALVTPVSTWASPRAVLALSDRRLLWLLDDAVMNRVRWLRLRDVCGADYTLAWPRRQRATLRVRTSDGRRHAFSDLRPALAERIVRVLQARPD